MRLLVIRDHAGADATCQALALHGVEAWPCPALRVETTQLNRWSHLNPEAFDTLCVLSRHAVDAVRTVWSPPQRARCLAVGPPTAQALEAWGCQHVVTAPPPHGSEPMWSLLAPTARRGHKVLVVSGQAPRPWLLERLRASNMDVTHITVYRRHWDPKAFATWQHRWQPSDAVWWGSGEALTCWEDMMARFALGDAARAAPMLTVSDRLVTLARASGFNGPMAVARTPNTIAATLQRWSQER